jgi:hypothetical protein
VANLVVDRGPRTVTNQQVHATTRAVPAECLEVDQAHLQPVSPR